MLEQQQRRRALGPRRRRCARPARAGSAPTGRRRRRPPRRAAGRRARRRGRGATGPATRRPCRRTGTGPSCACRAAARARSPSGTSWLRRPCAKASTKLADASSESSATSEYMRVSCAYSVRNGQPAAAPAAIAPARGPKIERAAHQAAGTVAQREQQRQRAGGGLAGAEERDPAVQEHVVERRRAVLDQRARDVRQRVRGDADGDALVDPVARVQRADAQQQRDGHGQAEAGHHPPVDPESSRRVHVGQSAPRAPARGHVATRLNSS